MAVKYPPTNTHSPSNNQDFHGNFLCLKESSIVSKFFHLSASTLSRLSIKYPKSKYTKIKIPITIPSMTA